MTTDRTEALGTDLFTVFSSALEREGIQAALAALLGPTRYRCAAIVRFDGERANATFRHQRERPRAPGPRGAVAPCCYARDVQGQLINVAVPVATETFSAVPIMDADGAIFATLCLSDPVSPQGGAVDLELLVRAAAELVQHEAMRMPPQPLLMRTTGESCCKW